MLYSSHTRRASTRHKRSFAPSSRPRGRQHGKENIHPSRFTKPAVLVPEIAYTPQHAFSDFQMHDLLRANIEAKGFAAPSPIQDKAIPVGLAGQDVIGIANTGTGKTIAFAIPVLNTLLADHTAKALIMAPTRELATQIEDEFRAIAKNSGLRGALLIGGTAMGKQLHALKDNPSIVIGTPGRIKDHMQRGTLNLNRFTVAVLDEVDRMLDMGFVNDVRFILGALSPRRQSFFFSATLDARVDGLVKEFSHDAITISVKTGDTTDTVDQKVVLYNGKTEKMEKLHDALIRAPKALVFDDTQHSVERLSKELQARGFQADAIHGGKSQGQRQRALNRFKGNEINVLVATDVAARGIDVSDITHVINYSTPQTYNDYVHRIGRAGRAGRVGYALTFIEQ